MAVLLVLLYAKKAAADPLIWSLFTQIKSFDYMDTHSLVAKFFIVCFKQLFRNRYHFESALRLIDFRVDLPRILLVLNSYAEQRPSYIVDVQVSHSLQPPCQEETC
jgi:hypothetical protein